MHSLGSECVLVVDLVNMVINAGVPIKAENFVTKWVTISFSRKLCSIKLGTKNVYSIFFLQVRDDWSEVGPTEDWISMEDLDGKTYCRYPGTWCEFIEIRSIKEITFKIKHMIGRQCKQTSNYVTVMSICHYVRIILPEAYLRSCSQNNSITKAVRLSARTKVYTVIYR